MTLNADTRRRIQSRIKKAKLAGDLATAQRAVEALIEVDSIKALQEILERNAFLASDWVIEIISDLRHAAEESGDERAQHNLRVTAMALAFHRDRKLRKEASVPPPLQGAFDQWNALQPRLPTLQGIELDKMIEIARALVESKHFSRISEILRRDILLNAGKALLIRCQRGKIDSDLDDSLSFMHQATRMCPDTSPDFAECTTYGGLALLLRHDRTGDDDSLETAIAVLGPAVAAASESLLNLLAQATTGLANAHLRRFTKAGDVEDLQQGADVLIYGLGVAVDRDEPVSSQAVRVAAQYSEQLGQLPSESERLEQLTEILEQALGGKFDENDELDDER